MKSLFFNPILIKNENTHFERIQYIFNETILPFLYRISITRQRFKTSFRLAKKKKNQSSELTARSILRRINSRISVEIRGSTRMESNCQCLVSWQQIVTRQLLDRFAQGDN